MAAAEHRNHHLNEKKRSDPLKSRNKRWRWIGSAILLLIALLFMLMPALLRGLGAFLDMSPSSQKCDAIIIEGGHTLSNFMTSAAIEAWRRGQVKKIVVTLSGYDGELAVFGLRNYDVLAAAEFVARGVPRDSFLIAIMKINEPYTYNAARALAPMLKKAGIRSVLLLHDNFHIKRSYLTYRKVLQGDGLEVHPYTVTIYLNHRNWWKNINGWRRVFEEYFKLAYYWYKDYI